MIRIKVEKWNREGELLPKYDNEANLLQVACNISQDWTKGIDIDGRIIFDLNDRGILVNFDVLIRKDLWKVVKDIKVPICLNKGIINVDESSILKKSHHLPLTLQTDKQKKFLEIKIGNQDRIPAEKSVFKLSEKCFFFISESFLTGFFIII